MGWRWRRWVLHVTVVVRVVAFFMGIPIIIARMLKVCIPVRRA
jgi:hypothetical protein